MQLNDLNFKSPTFLNIQTLIELIDQILKCKFNWLFIYPFPLIDMVVIDLNFKIRHFKYPDMLLT
jgi:hypothetical protein